jgi:hypothetical protein
MVKSFMEVSVVFRQQPMLFSPRHPNSSLTVPSNQLRCLGRASSLWFNAILHAVTFPLDNDSFGMVKHAIQDCRGERAVVIEDGRPMLENLVGGEHDGAALVTLADDLEEQIGAMLVNGDVAKFVNDQDGGPQILLLLADKIARLNDLKKTDGKKTQFSLRPINGSSGTALAKRVNVARLRERVVANTTLDTKLL